MPRLCEGSFREVRPEAVIHLAARAGVRPSLEQPLLYERVYFSGTLVLLEASREAGTGRFLFASSSSVYGIANHVPFKEDDHVIGQSRLMRRPNWPASTSAIRTPIYTGYQSCACASSLCTALASGLI